MKTSLKTIKYKTVPGNNDNRAIGYRIYRACGLVKRDTISHDSVIIDEHYESIEEQVQKLDIDAWEKFCHFAKIWKMKRLFCDIFFSTLFWQSFVKFLWHFVEYFKTKFFKIFLQNCFKKFIHKMRLTKYFRINNSQNETHKNITQKLFTKLDSEKCSTKFTKWDSHKYFTKIIDKRNRLTKMFHKKNAQNEIHKNILQN